MKVVIVCLNQKFGATAGKACSALSGLTYADCAEEIEISLAQKGAPLADVTTQWLEQNEREVVKKCLKCDIVSFDYNTFSRHRARINGDIIYLRLESARVDKIYSSRFPLLDLRLCGLASHVIKAAEAQAAAKEIEKIIGEKR